MAWDEMRHKRTGFGVVVFVVAALTAKLHADRIDLPGLNLPEAEASKVLHFPDDQCLGLVQIGPESGDIWNAKHVAVANDCWESVGQAQGDVIVPAGRCSYLVTYLSITPREAAMRRAREPLMYKLSIGDRRVVDPYDMSGLKTLDPNSLDMLTVCTRAVNSDADQRILEPVSRLTGLKILRLNETGVTDKGLEHLRSLTSLAALELYSRDLSPITSRGLAVLKDLPALSHLHLHISVTDDGLKQIGQMSNLRWLRFNTGSVWGSGLAELAHLPRLERLCLWDDGRFTDEHVKYLEGMKDLKALTFFQGCRNLTDASAASIGKLINLEELYFINTAPGFTEVGVASLKPLKKLRHLDFGLSMIGDESIPHLATLPRLESIEGGLRVTAEGMKTLGNMRGLKCLHVGLMESLQGYHGPTGLSYLSSLTSLEELSFAFGKITDEDLASLESLTNLKRFTISGKYDNTITDRGMVSIAKLRQLKQLDVRGVSITKQGLNQLGGLVNLQDLHVAQNENMQNVSDEATLHLPRLRHLKNLRLTGFHLSKEDLAFLSNQKDLEDLTISTQSLDADSLAYIENLGELKNLKIYGLDCSGQKSLASLNTLPKLYYVTVDGKISNDDLASLTTLTHVWSLTIHTAIPISQQTIDDLSRRLPGTQYIHVYSTTQAQKIAQLQAQRRRNKANRQKTNPRTKRSSISR